MKILVNKKTRYRDLAIIITPVVVLMGVLLYTAYSSLTSMVPTTDGPVEVKYSIDSMDYHLRNNATLLQEDLFEELNELIDTQADDELIVVSVVSNFVADFYTWSNKLGSYDVGGMYYVYSPNKNATYSDARDNFYKYVTHYIEEYGSENILEVASAESSIHEKSVRTIDGVKYDLYTVTCTWTYENHKGFTDKEYMVSGWFDVIKNKDGRFEIISAGGDLA